MKAEYQKIEQGAIVAVNFNNAQYTLCSKARVERIPIATGDSWIFFDLDKNKIYYVSEGCTITLLKAAPVNPFEKDMDEDVPF